MQSFIHVVNTLILYSYVSEVLQLESKTYYTGIDENKTAISEKPNVMRGGKV